MKSLDTNTRSTALELQQQTFDAELVTGHDEVIGTILQRGKGLDDEQIERALIYQHQHGGRLGEALVALGLAEASDIAWALSQQFHYPQASPPQIRLNEELIVANDPFSDKVEAFRDLRNQLLMGALAPELPRVALAIVSADSGDGKSFVAANLAAAFAQLEGRTLLVDCDLRSPRLHRLFDVEGKYGLATILSTPANDNVIRLIPGLPNLFLLPVGVPPLNPAELLERPTFPLLLRELRTKFDHVIVDTPAASKGSDARVIAARSGAALVIGRKNHSHTAGLGSLIKQLEKSAVRLAGIMMNEH